MKATYALRLWILRVVAMSAFGAGPFELKLWPGKAPGSENWTVPESITDRGGNRIATNVSEPTLTVFLPDGKGDWRGGSDSSRRSTAGAFPG